MRLSDRFRHNQLGLARDDASYATSAKRSDTWPSAAASR